MKGHRRAKSEDISRSHRKEEEDDVDECSHARSHCKLNNLKNKLPHAKPHCSICFPEGRKGHKRSASANSSTSDIHDVHDLMICLKCGDVFCGNGSSENHALAHFEKKRHSVFCNASSLISRCYACEREVSNVHLTGCVEVIRKLYSVRLGILSDDDCDNNDGGTKESQSKDGVHFVSSFRNPARNACLDSKLKGLVNLGNTCYFNSVLQCLGRTVPLCENNATIEASVKNPVMIVPQELPRAIRKESISLKLDEDLGPLTTSFIKMLKDMNDTDTKSVKINPKALLDAFSNKYSRFKDYDEQQDSQELLRTMLDGLEEEEEDRARHAIFKHFGLNCEKTSDPQFRELDASKQDELRSYMHGFLPRVSSVFRGTLKSTVTCQVCSNKTAVRENFLDISVPIYTVDRSVDKPRGTASRFFMTSKKRGARTNSSRMNKTDKKKAKKERKAEQREEQRAKRRMEKSKRKGKGRKRDRDIDIQDYDSEGSTSGHSRNPSGSNVHELVTELPGGNITVPKGDLMVPGGDPTVPDATDNHEVYPSEPLEVTINGSTGSTSVGDAEEEGTVADTNPVDKAELSAIGGKIQPRVLSPAQLEHKPSYTPKVGECSIEASLSELFREETLDGDDAFACEACYKAKRPVSAPPALLHENDGGDECRQASSDDDGSDTSAGYVMQTAKKRLAIQRSPQVLTIHLKRFEQHGMRLTKVIKHVDFPIILDLDAFCDEQAPRAVYDDGIIGIRYELYAVVEHSGKLDSGHYTAFVKDTMLSINGTPNKWWHISDDIARSCNESDVLKAQAYLLFYERLY